MSTGQRSPPQRSVTISGIGGHVHRNAQLLNRAREVGRPFNELLQYYAMERFLFRLSLSEHADSFVLKGALLFRAWSMPDSRATRDIDFMAYVENSPDTIADMIRDAIMTEVPDDGMTFAANSVISERIKEGAEYEGVRVRFDGNLTNARVRMQIDVGFGDVIHPAATELHYPTLLAHAAPVVRAYPPESVIAEKVEAMIHLGALNSRMKDFYDVWRLSRQHAFDGRALREAIAKTLEKRGTAVLQFPELRDELLETDDKQKQWSAFVKKSGLEGRDSFRTLLDELSPLLTPLLDAIATKKSFEATWQPPGPWHEPA